MVLDKTECTESLEAMRASSMIELRKQREMEKEMKRNRVPLPFKVTTKSDCVDTKLKILKSQEPNSDNLFFRLAIIGYEWGDLQRSIVYAERFRNKLLFRDGFKDKSIILSEGKLAMADMLTQLYLLTISLGWDWDELRELGAQHLEERHKDFKRDGWTEVEK